jgi:hypothetical protein
MLTRTSLDGLFHIPANLTARILIVDRRLKGCDRRPAHRGVLGRADIPDIDPPSILALLALRPLRTHGDME